MAFLVKPKLRLGSARAFMVGESVSGLGAVEVRFMYDSLPQTIFYRPKDSLLMVELAADGRCYEGVASPFMYRLEFSLLDFWRHHSEVCGSPSSLDMACVGNPNVISHDQPFICVHNGDRSYRFVNTGIVWVRYRVFGPRVEYEFSVHLFFFALESSYYAYRHIRCLCMELVRYFLSEGDEYGS